MIALDNALYTFMAADNAISASVGTKIYRQLAPQDVSPPFIIFQINSGGNENETPLVSKNYTYQVRAVSNTSPAVAGTIADEIESALDGATLTVAGYTNILTHVETEFQFAESDNQAGEIYWHAGYMVRVRLD